MAGRATFHSAHGYGSSSTIQSRQLSGKDLRTQTKLKFRQIGQATVQELKQKDFKKELDLKEQKNLLESDKTTAWMAKDEESIAHPPAPLLLKFTSDVPVASTLNIAQKYDDADVDDIDSDDSSTKDNADDGFDSSSRYVRAHFVV
jgi:protein CWC15